MDSAVIEAPAPKARGRVGARTVNLALQGGGSHGAFTWGVLDRMLEDSRLEFEGISGTSAGAMNGAVLAYGLASGGRERARELLERFWMQVSREAAWGPVQPTWLDRVFGNPNLDLSPLYHGFDLLMRMLSPYQFNPFGLNPLRRLLIETIDFGVLRRAQTPRLYVSATHVTKGKLRVFAGKDISVEALLASACLPFLFQAVEVNGEHYWDGGYMGNPTLYPLIHACQSRDIVMVQINPFNRDSLPMAPTAIVDRINEISFNSTFLQEARAMGLINRLLAQGLLDEGTCGLRSMHLHVIGAEERMAHLNLSSKFNADRAFLHELRDLGRETASAWLDQNFERIGENSTFEVESLFA